VAVAIADGCRPKEEKKIMDCVTMVLIQERTNLPLDLVVLIKSFLYEKLTDENFKQAIALWFENEEECKWRFGHISFWNTSRVTNMEKTFYNREDFDEDLSRWNVGKVKSMRSMFYGASQFNGALSSWDVSNLTDMSYMFYEASRFNEDISLWDVGNVTNMNCMFQGATRFNGDISRWDVSNVRNTSFMFRTAIRFTGDLSRWMSAVSPI
jgi:surface protein